MADKANYAFTGYRADPFGKFDVASRMETMPSYFHAKTVTDYAKALKAAEDLGGPQVSPEYLTNMILHEGRPDAGFNKLDPNNKKANALANELIDAGHPPKAAQFAGAVFDKMHASERLKKPFPELWNGTGKNKDTGLTGKDYNIKFEQSKYAATHPQNAELYGAISQAMAPSEWDNSNTAPLEDMKFKKGGAVPMPQEYTQGNWKLI